MTKLTILPLLILFGMAVALSGQSNDVIDKFLEDDTASLGTSLLLVAQSSGALGNDATPSDAYEWGTEQKYAKWVRKLQAEDPISLGLFYLALFESHNIRGGIMYSLANTPRYAAQEAAYKGYVESSRLFYTRSMPPFEVLTAIGEAGDE